MAQTIFTAVALKRQIPVYIMKKFDFVAMLEAIPKYKITSLMMVPPIVVVSFQTPISTSGCEHSYDRPCVNHIY